MAAKKKKKKKKKKRSDPKTYRLQWVAGCDFVFEGMHGGVVAFQLHFDVLNVLRCICSLDSDGGRHLPVCEREV